MNDLSTVLVAADTLPVAKRVATQKLLVTKEEARRTLKIATEIAKSMNQELILRQEALNAISQGVLITDAQRRTTYINDAFEKITGYAKADILGKSCAVLQGVETNPETVSQLRAALNAGEPFHAELLNYRKDSTPFWNDLSITPVKDSAGKLTQFVGVLRDVTDQKVAADKIEHLAFFDHLTDLPNRRLLMDRLGHAFTSSLRSGREGGLLFIDLDNFKDVNDTYGHDLGDLVLREAARRLESCMRARDTIARLGGDEFVVVLEDLSEQRIEAAKQVNAVGKKILAKLSQPYEFAGHEWCSTASIGAVLFSDHEHSADELLKRADIAMYRSKNAGRNTLTFFNDEMQNALLERVTIERELHAAIKTQQFVLYYQIQVDSANRVLGAEALIRWLHPTRGLLSPDQFIRPAEELGLMRPIGLWVLEAACTQLKAWQEAELTQELVLSVNVSAQEIRQPDFVEKVKVLIQRYAVNPSLLQLELTESILLESIDETIALMKALKAIGVTFSLDDFGTGFSSLQYIKRLPIDRLKIDRAFIRDIVTDSSDKVIVHTILLMAQNLHIRVIAEGVETDEQRQILLDSGCTQYQGYLFGRPLPIEQFEALLKQGK